MSEVKKEKRLYLYVMLFSLAVIIFTGWHMLTRGVSENVREIFNENIEENDTSEGATPPPGQWISYNSESWGFGFEYPEDATIVASSSISDTSYVLNYQGESIHITIHEGLELSEIIQMMKPASAIVDIAPNGIPGVALTLFNNSGVLGDSLYLLENPQGHYILEIRFSTSSSLLESIIETIRFTDDE
jgi:hypothetical protein